MTDENQRLAAAERERTEAKPFVDTSAGNDVAEAIPVKATSTEEIQWIDTEAKFNEAIERTTTALRAENESLKKSLCDTRAERDDLNRRLEGLLFRLGLPPTADAGAAARRISDLFVRDKDHKALKEENRRLGLEIEELREAGRISNEMRDHAAKRESIERVARMHAEGLRNATSDELRALKAEHDRALERCEAIQAERDETLKTLWQDQADHEMNRRQVAADAAPMAALRQMLGLEENDDVVQHVEGMADQISDLLGECVHQASDPLSERRMLEDRMAQLVAELRDMKHNYAGAMADCSEVLSIVGAEKDVHPVRAVREAFERLTRERDSALLAAETSCRRQKVWAVTEEALAILGGTQEETLIGAAKRVMRALKDKVESLVKVRHLLRFPDGASVEYGASVLSRLLDSTASRTAELTRERNEARAVQGTLRGLLEAINEQLSLPANAPWETTTAALKALKDTSLHVTIVRCANVAQEEAHRLEMISSSLRGDVLNQEWANARAKVARSIESKILALLEGRS